MYYICDMENKDIVLVGDVYVEDGWYGKRYRIVLRPTVDGYFKNKTECKKYEAKVKKYVKNRFETTVELLYIGEHNKLVDYRYISLGPSIYYHRTELTIESLIENLNK